MVIKPSYDTNSIRQVYVPEPKLLKNWVLDTWGYQFLAGTLPNGTKLLIDNTKANLPNFPGLYAVVNNKDQFLYIGISTVSIKERWVNHHRSPVLNYLSESIGLKIYYHTLPVFVVDKSLRASLLRLEYQLIKHIKPVFNDEPI